MHYNKDGTPLELLEWARLFEDTDYRRIGDDEIQHRGIRVSTVWMGMNHRFTPGRPLIFETMLFVADGDPDDLGCWRWSTQAEALAGHQAIVAALTEGVPVAELYDHPGTQGGAIR